MADANLNFATGVLGGVSTGLDLLDRLDARKRRQETQGREDIVFNNSLEDREANIARQATADEREAARFDNEQENQAYATKRREIVDKHQDALLPIQRRAAQYEVATAETQNKIANQQLKTQEVTKIWSEAAALFDGGEYEQADKSIAQLAGYGYDVEGMSTGDAQMIMDTTEKFITGELSYGDPAVKDLARKILTPSLVMSGRDPNRFEIAGIIPTGRIDPDDGSPTYAVTMIDKETGKPVPATLNRTSAADNDPNDPITEVSQNDLMAGTQGLIEASTMSTQVRLKAIGAGLGQRAADKSAPDALARAKIQAEIEKIKAETGKIAGETKGGGVAGGADPMMQLFASSYESESPIMQNIAATLQQEPGFTPEEGVKVMAGIKELRKEKDLRDNQNAYQLLQIYRQRKDVERIAVGTVAEKVSNFIAQYPTMSKSDQEELADKMHTYVMQLARGVINDKMFAGQLKSLNERYTKKYQKSLSPQEQKRNETPRSLEQLERKKLLEELPDAAALRGY